jgi:hypothetical protein
MDWTELKVAEGADQFLGTAGEGASDDKLKAQGNRGQLHQV